MRPQYLVNKTTGLLVFNRRGLLEKMSSFYSVGVVEHSKLFRILSALLYRARQNVRPVSYLGSRRFSSRNVDWCIEARHHTETM
jgi:hypothetical protein